MEKQPKSEYAVPASDREVERYWAILLIQKGYSALEAMRAVRRGNWERQKEEKK